MAPKAQLSSDMAISMFKLAGTLTATGTKP